MANSEMYDGFFRIEMKEEGALIEVFAPQGSGKLVSAEEIKAELEKKAFGNIDMEKIQSELSKISEQGTFVLPNTVDMKVNLDNSFRIELSEDKMSALITFYPDDAQVKLKPEELLKQMQTRKIVLGIKNDIIEQICEEHEYNRPYVIAEGIRPIDATPAEVKLLFKTTKDFTPEIDADGNVNYKKLNTIAHVKEGELLAELIPGVEGVSGKDLAGNEIKAKPAKQDRIKFGKNTKISDDKTKLYATVSGLVKIFDGKVVVNNVFEAPNNVGPTTGDLDFEGSIVVHGNVMTGYTLRAKGDIEVLGVVEGATVISGGNIIIHKGVQGGGQGRIEAVGNIQVKFIENAEVLAGGDIHSEAILHSTVSCKGTITVEGKKGMISGGTVRAGTQISSKILGSHMGTPTLVEVGIDPILLEEYTKLKKELPKIVEEAGKLEQVILLLNKRKEVMGQLEEDKQEMYMSAVRNKIFLQNKVNTSQKRLDELQLEVDNRHSGTVRVSGVMYPGVKVGISSLAYYVKNELKYVMLYKDGADIKLSSL